MREFASCGSSSTMAPVISRAGRFKRCRAGNRSDSLMSSCGEVRRSWAAFSTRHRRAKRLDTAVHVFQYVLQVSVVARQGGNRCSAVPPRPCTSRKPAPRRTQVLAMLLAVAEEVEIGAASSIDQVAALVPTSCSSVRTFSRRSRRMRRPRGKRAVASASCQSKLVEEVGELAVATAASAAGCLAARRSCTKARTGRRRCRDRP